MDKLIPLNKGIHRQPSVGTDGELSELVNLIPQNGELVNVRGLKSTESHGIEGTLIAVHKVEEGLNYIYLSENTLISKTYNGTDLNIGSLSGYKDVGIIGNTVCISTDTGMMYALWRGDKYIQFTQENLTYKFNVEYEDTRRFQEEYVTVDLSLIGAEKNRAIFRAADKKVNEIISARQDPNKWFKYITLGMAALKLYDGSYVMYSNIFTLDPPSRYHGVGVSVDATSTNNNVEVAGSLMAYKITVSLTKTYALIKDIVSSVDIFLSLPTGFFDMDSSDAIVNTYFPKKGYEDIIKEIDGMQFFKSLSFNIDEFKADSNDDYYVTKSARRVTGTEQSLDLSGIQGVFYTGECVFPYNGRLTLGNVVSRLRSVNSPDMNQKAVGDKIITNVANITNESNTSRANTYFLGYYDMLADYVNEADVVIEVDIAGGDGGYMRTYRYKGTMQYPFPPIISYPDANAKTMRIYVHSPNRNSAIFALATITLSSLSLSNMAVAVNVVENDNEQLSHLSYLQPFLMRKNQDDFIVNNKIMPPNKSVEWEELTESAFNEIKRLPEINPASRDGNGFVYSTYGNPFSLNTISNIRIGNGEIKGVSSSVKALSQGQFGQFPLYVFCSDGVYALEVAADGTFSATNPASRDVCNNPESITQIDGAVVFTTDQGLMMIQGSEVVNLSGAMEGYNVDESDYFEPTDDGTPFFESYGMKDFDKLVITETSDFRDILKSCKIAYDYVNKMLRIFPMGDNFNDKYYVYSLESGEYATVYQKNEITTVVPDYPSSIVQIGGALYRPSERDNDKNTKKGLLLTRPIMLDEPFALKKLHDIRLHYSKFYEKSKCHVIVYVSNDGNHWMQLKSLRRRSYKYYRFAIITDMKDMDALSGMVLRYEVERNNKLR